MPLTIGKDFVTGRAVELIRVDGAEFLVTPAETAVTKELDLIDIEMLDLAAQSDDLKP